MDSIQLITCTVEGISPLLMHRFTDEDQLSASNGTRVASAATNRGTPLEQATASLYTNENNEIIMPQPCIMASIINGGKFFKAGKSKITTLRSSLIPSALQIPDLYFPLQHKEPWEVDTRPVRMPSTGGRILRHRPKFNDWAFTFTMELDTQEMPASLIREIIDAAGKKIGLCDYRPECKGPFGRFVVTAWTVE